MNQITINSVTTSVLSHAGQRVVTTDLLGQFYGTESVRIRQNYVMNADRFVEGKRRMLDSGKRHKTSSQPIQHIMWDRAVLEQFEFLAATI